MSGAEKVGYNSGVVGADRASVILQCLQRYTLTASCSLETWSACLAFSATSRTFFV